MMPNDLKLFLGLAGLVIALLVVARLLVWLGMHWDDHR